MKLFIVLYWTWLGISLMILGRRLVRRLTRSTSPSSPAPVAPANAGPVAPANAGPVAVIDAAPADVAPIDVVDQPDEPAPAAPIAPVAGADTRPYLVEPQVGRPLTGTVFAPLNPPSPTFERARINRTYLADALEGISMPCDLAPLVNVDGVDPARRAVFSTATANAEMVGSCIASELGRLGYSLEALSATEALARRGDDAVNVRINAIGPALKKGPADPRFPTAAANSVVLDLEIT